MAQNPKESDKVPQPILNFNKEVTMTACALGTGDMTGDVDNGNDVDDMIKIAKYLKSETHEASIMALAAAKEEKERSNALSQSLKSKLNSKSKSNSNSHSDSLLKANPRQDLMPKARKDIETSVDRDMLNLYFTDGCDSRELEKISKERIEKNEKNSQMQENESKEDFEERMAILEYSHAKPKGNGNIKNMDQLDAPFFDQEGSLSPYYGINNDDIEMNAVKEKEREIEKEKEKEKAEKDLKDYEMTIQKSIDKLAQKRKENPCYLPVRGNKFRDNNNNNEILNAPFRPENSFSKNNVISVADQVDNLMKNMPQNMLFGGFNSNSKKPCLSPSRLQRLHNIVPQASSTGDCNNNDNNGSPNSNNESGARSSVPILKQN